jgi:hypothetical protein
MNPRPEEQRIIHSDWVGALQRPHDLRKKLPTFEEEGNFDFPTLDDRNVKLYLLSESVNDFETSG